MLETVFNKDLGCASCFQTTHGFVISVWALLSLACHSIFKVYSKYIQNICGTQNVTKASLNYIKAQFCVNHRFSR